MNINEKGQIVAEFNGVVYNMRLRKNDNDRTIVLDPKNKSMRIFKGGTPDKCSTLPLELLIIIAGYADPKTTANLLMAMKNLSDSDVCNKMNEIKNKINAMYESMGPLYNKIAGQHYQDIAEYQEIEKQLEEKRNEIMKIMDSAILNTAI